MNIFSLIFGNACSLLAMGTDSLSSSRKTTNAMLGVQNVSQLIYCIGSIALKGYSGAVQNVICIVRNLIVMKGRSNKFIEWLLVILGVVLGVFCNNIGFWGLLPVIANVQYTLAVFRFQGNELALKIAFFINAVLFIFFNFAILNFVGVGTNAVVAIATIISLIKEKKPHTYV